MDLAGWGQFLAGVAALAGVLLAAIAALVAWQQLQTHKRAAALDMFGAYLRTAFDNPELSEPNFEDIQRDEVVFRQYRRYVAMALTACERVLLYSPKEDYWGETIAFHVWLHRHDIITDYFKGVNFPLYSSEMKALFRRVRAEAFKDAPLRQMLAQDVETVI